MNELHEQYRRELYNQEINSNKRTLKGFVWFFVTLVLIWVLTLVNFFIIDKTMISAALGVTAILFMPPLGIYLKGDLAKRWLKYFFLALICIVAAIIASFLTFHAVFLYVIPLLFAIQYRKRSALWFAFATNIATMLVSSYTGFYYGLCDLNILLESSHTRSWYLSIITEEALHIPFNENPAFIILVFEVFPRAIILFIFTIMLQYTIISSMEDALRIAELTYSKETDMSTRLFNKNKYEEMVEEYYPGIQRVAAVFWDLNNLKMINDRFGHASGDALIETMSSALYAQSSERCRVYRIGGDEFLMLIDNPLEGEAKTVVAAVKELLKRKHEEGGLNVSSAVGWAEGAGSKIKEIIKTADERMYEDKAKSREGRR